MMESWSNGPPQYPSTLYTPVLQYSNLWEVAYGTGKGLLPSWLIYL